MAISNTVICNMLMPGIYLTKIKTGGLSFLAALLLTACTAPQPMTGYTAGPIENQLMAEIALQRGEYLVSVQQYLALAQQSDNPEFARRGTELAYEYGFDAYALACAQRWVELQPANRLAQYYLGQLYVRRNSLDAAWSALEIGLGPASERTLEDYTRLSADLSGNTEPERALTLFKRFNEQYPEQTGVLGSISGLAAETGDLELAIAAARETVQLSPDWVGSRIWLARFLLAEGDVASAFEQMAFALEMSPGLDMELEFVRLLASAGEFEDALDRLNRLDERFPDAPDLVRTRALVQLQAGNLDAAQIDLTQLLASAYCVNECFWYLGQIAMERGDYPQSIRYSGRVNSGLWLESARLNITQAYLRLGDVDTALQVQESFASQYPKYTFATFQPRAEMLAGMGRYGEALELVELAIQYKPWRAELWLYKGGVYEQLGDSATAIKAFRRAAELAPDDAQTLNALGYTLTVNTRKYAEAQAFIGRALELDPDSPAILDSMGWVLFKQGDVAAARGWLERAYVLLPDPEIAAHLGEVLWAEGKQDAAIELWTDALQTYPDSPALNETTQRVMK